MAQLSAQEDGQPTAAGRDLRVQLLGTVGALRAGRPLALGGPKERALLAALAVHTGQPVSTSRLMDALWGDDPPRTAAKTLQSYVSRLRRAGLPVEATAGGYILRLGDDQLDVFLAERLVADARQAMEDGEPAVAADLLEQAERLWQGPSLGEQADQPFALGEANRLEELRLVVVEERVAARLALGEHAQLVGELEALCRAHPLRERLWGARIVSLYRCGRQAEALRAFQEVRTVLIEEVGIEPGSELRALEAAVLAQSPELDPPATSPAALPSGVVTLLLTDIESSSALWEADPDAMAAALEMHDHVVTEVVSAHGGRMLPEKREGDAAGAVFARASSAAAAAVALRQRLDPPAWTGPVLLKVRMALHSGEASGQGRVSGPALSRASALRSAARGTEILVSAPAADLLADRLPEETALIDLGTRLLPGLARPERVFLLRPGTARERDRDDDRVHLPLPPPLSRPEPFAGREAELGELWTAWEAVAAGRRRTVMVAGEPGIGKTRLCGEAGRRVHDAGGVVLYGRCDEDLAVPYQPFVEALGSYVEALSADRLRREAGVGAPELARLVPALADRLEALPPARRADPESERYLLFEAVTALLAAATGRAPVLLVLDDLQWATQPTLLMLRHLVRSPIPMSLLVVAVYRNTELDRGHPLAAMLSDLRRDGNAERLTLAGLGEDAVRQLVADAGPVSGDASRLGSAILTGTGGNPFFVGEVLRHLAETGAAAAGDFGLPEGIREVISRRLSRLSPESNRILTAGAVTGPRFSLRVLERVGELGVDGDRLLDGLDEAIAAEVVRECRDRPGEYEFAHALIRQTVLSELSSTRTARLHRRVGEALEEVSPPGANLDALAFHFGEAALDGQAGKAVDYARRAAAAAVDRLAYEEAVSLLERALHVIDLAEAVDHGARAQTLSALADAAWRAGDSHRAKTAAADAAVHAAEAGEVALLAQAAVVHTTASTWGEIDPVSAELCERALTALGDAHPGLRARVLAGLSYYRAAADNQGPYAQVLAEDAVELARQSRDDEALADGLYAQAIALLGSSRLEQRRAVGEELLALGARHGNAEWRARGLRVRGLTWMEGAERARFEADLAELQRLGRELGSWVWQATALELEVLLALLDGRLDEVDALSAAMLGAARHDPNFLSVWAGQVAIVKREKGEAADLIPLAEAALEDRTALSVYRAMLAALMADAGDLERAAQQLDILADEDFNAIPRDIGWPSALVLSADVCVKVGDRQRAPLLYRHLRPYSGQLVAMAWGVACLGAADRFMGELAWLTGRVDDARSHLEAAARLEEAVGAGPALARTQAALARLGSTGAGC